jgi:hypothetical protein
MFKRAILFMSKMQHDEGVLVCVGIVECILNHDMRCVLIWVSPRVGNEECRRAACLDLLSGIAPQPSRL